MLSIVIAAYLYGWLLTQRRAMIARIGNILFQGNSAYQVASCTAVGFDAVIEYLSAQVIELLGMLGVVIGLLDLMSQMLEIRANRCSKIICEATENVKYFLKKGEMAGSQNVVFWLDRKAAANVMIYHLELPPVHLQALRRRLCQYRLLSEISNSRKELFKVLIIVIENYSKKGVVGQHDGYTSMAIIYAVFTFANFVAAPIVNALNAKRAMVFGGITYCLFQVGFLFLNKAYLYLSSALIGIGAAVIWTAQGKYLALNSTDETAQKNTGVFWAISQACIVLGGIFLYIVFHSSDEINDETMRILYGVFTVMTLIGILILGALRLPTTVVPHISIESGIENILEPQLPLQETHLTHMQVIGSTIRLTLTKRMLLMAIVFAYSGVELSFWSAIYPTCITFTSKLATNTALVPNTKTLLGLNAIAQGLGQASSGFLFGILGSKTRGLGRDRIVILGALVHLVAFIGIFINFPALAPLYPTGGTGLIEPSVSLALLCGFLLGFGDACWNTQIFAFLITTYSSKSAQAFSLFKFFQSLLTCAAFFYSSTLMLQYHLAILVVGAVVACTAFFLAERMPSNEDDDQQVPHND